MSTIWTGCVRDAFYDRTAAARRFRAGSSHHDNRRARPLLPASPSSRFGWVIGQPQGTGIACPPRASGAGYGSLLVRVGDEVDFDNPPVGPSCGVCGSASTARSRITPPRLDDTHSSSSDRQTNFATTARLSPGLRSRCSHDRIAPVRPTVTWSSDSSPSPINRLSKWQLPVAEF